MYSTLTNQQQAANVSQEISKRGQPKVQMLWMTEKCVYLVVEILETPANLFRMPMLLLAVQLNTTCNLPSNRPAQQQGQTYLARTDRTMP